MKTIKLTDEQYKYLDAILRKLEEQAGAWECDEDQALMDDTPENRRFIIEIQEWFASMEFRGFESFFDYDTINDDDGNADGTEHEVVMVGNRIMYYPWMVSMYFRGIFGGQDYIW